MAVLWLTYAWSDNHSGDVDFMAQELQRAGLTVKLDRWNIQAGGRLWEQIGNLITDPAESDGWMIYATQNSLGSEPCREELAYAIGRALKSRGDQFPLVALFPGSVDPALIPPAIGSRLHVSATDPDWKERTVAAVERRSLNTVAPLVQPFEVRRHPSPNPQQKIIEVRPRAGSWVPAFIGVPAGERAATQLHVLRGPRGVPPSGGITMMPGEGLTDDGSWWLAWIGDEVTPTQSLFGFCTMLPSEIVFGALNQPTQYRAPLG